MAMSETPKRCAHCHRRFGLWDARVVRAHLMLCALCARVLYT